MQDILRITSKDSSTILDFFGGSGTTAQAVLELNREDGGNRKFILITNNEISPRIMKDLEFRGLGSEEIKNEGICRKICYPRIKKVIVGYRSQGKKKLYFLKERSLSIQHWEVPVIIGYNSRYTQVAYDKAIMKPLFVKNASEPELNIYGIIITIKKD